MGFELLTRLLETCIWRSFASVKVDEMSHGFIQDNFICVQTNLSVRNYSYNYVSTREGFGSFEVCASFGFFLGLYFFFFTLFAFQE